MVAIIHDNGIAVAKVSKFDMGFDGVKMYPYIQAENVYNVEGVLLKGDKCEVISSGKEFIGEVYNVGAIITQINILGETTGIKDKIKKWLNK